jgi:hypothetical protein
MSAISDFVRATGMSRLTLATLVVFAVATGAAPAAKAAILSMPAVGFIQYCEPSCPDGAGVPTLDHGVLKANAFTRLYAAVDFPVNGQKICSLSIVYQDINNNDAMTATLFRKGFVVGGNAFNNPVAVGSVSSAAGVVNSVRKTTKALDSPIINENTGFYYVQVTLGTFNLNLIGVQIDYRPTCPAP